MTSSLVTSLLLPGYDAQNIVASVIGADATATTYLLNCPPGTDSNDCGTYNQSLTLGPWASQTPVSGQPTTGAFDMYITMDYDEPWEFSLHCEMTRTVAQECTSINIGGNNDGTPTATIGGEELTDFEFAYSPITITAGLEKLEGNGAQATGGSASTTGDASTTGEEGSESSGGADDDSAAVPIFGMHLAGVFAGAVLAGVAANLL